MLGIHRRINAVANFQKSLSACSRTATVASLVAVYMLCQPPEVSLQSRPFNVARQQNSRHSVSSPAAEALFEQAEQLRKDWKVESIREAIKKYQEALAHWQASVEPLRQIRVLIAIGDAYAILSENDKRLDAYKQALKLVQSAQNFKTEVEVVSKIARAYVDLGEANRAFKFCDRALALSREIGDRKGEAESLNAIGSAQGAIGDLTRSIETFHQALNLWQTMSNHQGQAEALINLGYIYDDSGEIQQALEAYKQSLEHSQKAGDRQGEALAFSAIGRVQAWLGEKQKALDYHNDALKLFREMGFRNGEASTWNNIGAVYEDLGEYPKALESYNRALQLYRLARHRSYEALTIGYVGKMYLLTGDKKHALEHFNQKLRISRAVTDYRMQGYTLKDIGSVFEALGKRWKALAYYEQALKLQRTRADRRGQAYTLNAIGQIYDAVGNKKKAIGYYQEALQLIKAAEDRSGEVATLFNIAKSERDLGNLDKALTLIEEVLRLVELLRNRLVNQEMRLDYFAHVHLYREFHIGLLMSLHKLHGGDGFVTTAFEMSEQARARVLLELLAEAQVDIRRGVDDELLQRERLLRQQIEAKAAYNARLLYNPAAAEQLVRVKQELTDMINNYQEVQAQIRVKSPAYAELVQPAALTLPEIQQQVLDADTVLLEYSIGESRSYLWAVTSSSIRSYELPGRAEIERATRAMLDAIIAYEPQPNTSSSPLRLPSRPTEEQYLRRAVRLSRILLGPVADQLGSQRLLIVSEGILQYVPFAALPGPEKSVNLTAQNPTSESPKPLLVNHEVVHLPSASVLRMLRRQIANRAPSKKTIAVIADPVFDKYDSRLQTDGSSDDLNPSFFSKGSVRKAFVSRSANDNQMRFPRLIFTRREAKAILASAADDEAMEALGFKPAETQC